MTSTTTLPEMLCPACGVLVPLHYQFGQRLVCPGTRVPPLTQTQVRAVTERIDR